MSDVVLHLGDCLSFMHSLPDGAVDAVVTDPPYGIKVQNNYGVGNRGDKERDDTLRWDNSPLNTKQLAEIRRVGKQQIIWGANYHNCFDGGGAIIWDKLQPLSDSSQCEIASVSGYKKVFKYTQRWTNFVNTKQTDHPTEKPLDLFVWLIEMFTIPGSTVFDPFMGSGTTGVACVRTGRRFIGCEISPEYFATAQRRIAEAQMQPPLFPHEPAAQAAQLSLEV